MEGEREGRKLAGNTPFNSKKNPKFYVAVIKYRASHNTA